MTIPFLDLKSQHSLISDELISSFRSILDAGWFITGDQLANFEMEFAAYCDVQHCIGVANGLDAIFLLLKAYGIADGDEVIVPSNTFIATWLAVTRTGATPIPVDPNEFTFNIEASAIAKAVTSRTRAIIPVHLYGQSADMEGIMDLAESRGLVVIEDAAQSQGALYKGKPTGGLGHAAATSFYPGKNLGALGDGGAIMTNTNAIAEKAALLRNYGSTIKYQHDELGFNSRLDEMQAAFLRVKLQKLDQWNVRRRNIAERYSRELNCSNLITPYTPTWAEPVWHLYVIRHKNRDLFQALLNKAGVSTMIHYPIPPHLQKCYLSYRSWELPVAERLAKEVLSLPLYPSMTDEQVDFVIHTVNSINVE